MRKLLILNFLLIALFANARQPADDSLLLKPVFQNLTGEVYTDLSFTHKGIHFRDEFLPGKIWFTNGDSLGNVSLRYNSFEDQLIWLSKKHGQVLLDGPGIAKFSFKNRDTAFLFKKLQLPDAGTGFFQVFYEGKIKLYAKRKSVPYTSYIHNAIKYYKYRQAPVYCLVVNGKVYIINRNIKNLYQMFPGKEEAIRKSIRGKRLHFKREGDFVKAIIAMESILAE